MPRLNLKAVEERVRPLGGREQYDREFIFELLAAYGRSAGNITRLRNGSLNVADDKTQQVAQKGVLWFTPTADDPLGVIDALRTAPSVVRYAPRFVIVTDYVDLLAVDTKTNETLAIPIRDIDTHFTFFLPWAGMEKAQYVAEAHADVKAAERMARLFDELVGRNPDLLTTQIRRHGLNVFFTRLLFCFFAEDTGIFVDSQFTDAVTNLTQADGSDVHEFLDDVFNALDTAEVALKPAHLAGFPYVNGRLFTSDADHDVPVFTRKARDLLIESGHLRWSEINPDIFGSMFQAVVTPGQRSNLGQHYTSVPNILKTIEPLFLDALKEQFDAAFDSARKLEALHDRIAAIKIFDPACGSGNFLVIAYKELRRLEHAILERIGELQNHHVLFANSRVDIERFYGLEIDDFAAEVAVLSLWIAKHQMNREFLEKFGLDLPLIPLKQTGQIQCGNAARLEWNEVCPNNGTDEIYLISNPPYSGSSMQSGEQKEDFRQVFGRRPFSWNLDYISLWFMKGADYVSGTHAQLAFVTTNSVTQGEHVGLLFPSLFATGIEIGFAHTSFRWENNAKRAAGVTVAIIGIRMPSNSPKYLYTEGVRLEARHINGYLADAANVFIHRQMRPLSSLLPPMVFGSKPTDGGFLILEPTERDELSRSPVAASFVKRYVGADEYINDRLRFCLWIPDKEVAVARGVPEISRRLDRVASWRRLSKAPSTVDFAARPHRFKQLAYKPTEAIIAPSVSSERRPYIPFGYVDRDVVVSNLAYAIYDAKAWLFAVLTSNIHMIWTRAVGGRMKTDYRYTNTIVYNNFPVPPLSEENKELLTLTALRILDVREYHSERTLAQLYDPDGMPADLRLAHRQNDELVDSIYRHGGFETDEERLSHLFALYGQKTAKEQQRS